jgi:hypothetical protein
VAGHARAGVERQPPLGCQVGRRPHLVVDDAPRFYSRSREHGRPGDGADGGGRGVAHSATELRESEAYAMVLRSGPGNRAEWALTR